MFCILIHSAIDALRHASSACFCAIVLAVFQWSSLSIAISAQAVVSADLQIQMGYGGRIKLGCWQPFVVKVPDRLEPIRFAITVLDGDETPVTYCGPLHAVGPELNEHQGYLKLGKGFGNAELKLFDREGVAVANQTFRLRQLNDLQIISPTDSMVLTIEAGESVVGAIAATGISDRTRNRGIRLTRPGQLPVHSFCYEGIEAIYLVPKDLDWLKRVSKLQWAALHEWLCQGGQLIVSVGPGSQNWFAPHGALSEFLDGEISGTTEITNCSRLEAFAGSTGLVKNPAETLPITRIDRAQGVVVVEQDGMPCIFRSALGLGELVTVTFDLNQDQLVNWNGYKNMIYRLQYRMALQEAAQGQRITMRGKSVSHPGYDDLIGQLRVPLDQFSKVQFVSFNWIALLIGLYILCIGPGDYFLLRRFAGKMELTWITFPLISLMFCGLAVWISKRTRTEQFQLNQLEIIDIDSVSSRARGTIWCNYFSPRAGTCQIELNHQNSLGIEVESDLVGWQGLPGKGFGGMQAQSGVAVIHPPYVQTRSERSPDDVSGFTRLDNVPLNVSSTKPLLTQYQGRSTLRIQSNLRVRPRGLGLEGTIVNPFDFPLKNCRLLYENDVYELNEALAPGEAIAVESETKVRTLVGYLTRQRTVANEEKKSQNTQSLPWDMQETRIPRIADLLMFYAAAGGSNYTGLTHDYQSYIDLSKNLSLGRAILVAEIDGLGSCMKVDGKGGQEDYDQVVTLIRIMVPVTSLEKSR
jgi:hypothetical protein